MRPGFHSPIMVRVMVIFISFVIVAITGSACSDTGSDKIRLTVSIMHSDTLQEIIEEFELQYPKIDITIREYPMPDNDYSYDKYVKAVNTEIFSSSAADIISLQGLPYEEYVEKGVLLNIDKYISNDSDFTKDNYLMNIIDGCRFGGSLHMMPLSFSTMILGIDKEFMPSPELDIDPYKLSWDDYIRLCRNIYATNGNKPFIPEMVPFPFSSVLVREAYMDFIDFTNKKSYLTDGSFSKILDYTKETNDLYIDESETDIMIFKQLKLGDEAKIMMLGIRYMVSFMQLKTLFGDGLPFLCLPVPKNDSGNMFSLMDVYGINAATKHPDESWLFLKYMLSEAVQNDSNGIPVNRKALNYQIRYFDSFAGISKGPGEPLIPVSGFTAKEENAVYTLLESLVRLKAYNSSIDNVILEELEPFYKGEKSAADTAASIQDRVSIYLEE